ncbi:MAG: hypothetical protein HY897_08325 [Deltaproteobacteria bacterium]|nr:hypothetical protein [Deltaproteobacteria bacterium]
MRKLYTAMFALLALSLGCDDLLPDAGGGWTAKLNDYTTWDLTLTQDDVNLTGALKTTIAQDQAGDSPLADYLPTADLDLSGNIATKEVVLNKTYDANVAGNTVPVTLNFKLTLNDDNTEMAGTVNFGGIPESEVPEASQDITFTKKE